MALVMGVFMAGCSDDEYTGSTTTLLDENSVVTGSADVTATSATLHGTVTGLDDQSTSAYAVGFNYGSSADALTESVKGSSGAEFSATITGTTGSTFYYQAFVTLQNKVTYTGEVKSLVLTNATAETGAAADLAANSVKLSATYSNAPADAECGILLSGVSGDENVRNGVRLTGATASQLSLAADGLLPATTYYYCAYIDLGNGQVYGEVKQFTTPSQTFDLDNDLVDLGLSTKWAKFNIGASKETETGGLFGFGDMTGYNTSIDPADYASADIYKTANDIANKIYDGKVTMPTIDEFEELFTCCTTEWTSDYEGSGVSGYKFTGPNGNSIFLPAAGSRTQGTVTGLGTEGRYLSGSVNANDPQYAMSYIFNSSTGARTTTPVYQALSVRPVSVAKSVKFDKSLLYKTWEIDLTTDGGYQVFAGPTYFYGTDDSWRTVTNNEPIIGDVWSWEADFANNSWAVGGSAAYCQGSITFNEDGTVTVVHIDGDGKETTENGTYTVDEENKTITLSGATVLAPANYTADYVNSLTTDIKILSLTDKSLQLAVVRTESPCLLSINMIPQLEKYGYTAKLTCYGGNDDTTPDAWSSGTVTVAGGQTGTYNVKFTTEYPRTDGKVYVLDIVGFAAAYPNAFVKIDAIKADGTDVPFDANKFYYGDLEGNGNFRVEMANIWGVGHNDSWNGLKDTPFHKGGGETTNETALAFNETFEVTFTIVSLDADLSFTAKQTAVGLEESWNMPGNWGIENPGAVKVVLDAGTHQYRLDTTGNVALTMTSADTGGTVPNGAVNLVDIVGIRSYFPGFTADLVSVVNDGTDVPFTASKLKTGDIEGNGNFRIELHNIWGAGTAADPAFGGTTTVAGNNCVTSLGFSESSVYTIGNFSTNLFSLPW